MNYEEFIKKNRDKLNEVTNLYFSEEEDFFYITVSGDPSQYIDIASKCDELSYVLLDNARDSNYYKSIAEFFLKSNDTVKIVNGPVGKATKEEFFRSEEKIEEVVSRINLGWTTKQKASFVHYEIGKMISYTPDFCFSGKYLGDKATNDARNIWKSLDNGFSVCNGIATLERNILSRVDVKTQELSSGTHAFVLIETEEGNIISDPTWDLANTLFDARPEYFGKTYEELQEIDGPLSKAHRLEQIPENVVQISDAELREIYYSIGLATEDRKFKLPILDKLEEIEAQHFETDKEKVDALLQMFTENFSKEVTHLSESRTMLENCMTTLGIDRKNITTKFVYLKEDLVSENPYLCIHINGEEMTGSIACLNIEEMRFKNIQIKEFDELYKTHEEDTREPFWKKYLQREEKERNTLKIEEKTK